MKKLLITVVALWGLPFLAYAQSVPTYSNDPSNLRGVIKVNGRAHVFSAETESFRLQLGDGTVVSMPLSQVINSVADKAGVTPAQAYADILDVVSNPNYVFTQTDLTMPRLAITSPIGGGGGGQMENSGYAMQAGQYESYSIDVAGGFVPAGMMENGNVVPGLGGPCDLSPCTPYWGRDGRVFYQMDGGTAYIGEGSVPQQKQYADDFSAWQREQRGSCEDMKESMIDASFAGGAVAYTCPQFMQPVGAAACLASLGYFVYQNRQVAKKAKACTAKYPGPGKW